VNERCLLRHKFEWQDEYYAVSVSESRLFSLREYIRNQEEHHRKRTFAEEFEKFLRDSDFERSIKIGG